MPEQPCQNLMGIEEKAAKMQELIAKMDVLSNQLTKPSQPPQLPEAQPSCHQQLDSSLQVPHLILEA
jgi:hypothetical protein